MLYFCAISVVFIAILVKYYFKRGLQSDFIFLSIIFIWLFFVLPGILAGLDNSFVYAGYRYNVSEQELFEAAAFLGIFIGGFFAVEWYIQRSQKNSRSPVPYNQYSHLSTNFRSNTKYYIFALLGLLLVAMYYINSGYTENNALVRRGEIPGNPFLLLLFTACSLISVLCLEVFQEKNKRMLQLVAFLSVLAFALLQSGRTNFVFTLALGLVALGIPLKRSAAIVLIAFPFIIPFIRDGKSLLYLVATGQPIDDVDIGGWMSFTDFHLVYFDTLMSNFAHPFVSLLNADILVDLLGFRYFYDYIQGFLFYFRLLGIDFGDSLTYYNTEIISGVRVSIYPTGMLAFGYVQMHVLGVFVAGAFYRAIGYYSQKLLRLGNDSRSVFNGYVVLCTSYSFYTGEIRTMVISVFFPLFVAWIWIKIRRH